MPAIIERPMSPGAVWSRRVGVFSFVLLVVIGLAHRYGMLETPDLPPLLAIVIAAVLVSIICALIAFRRYWFFDDKGGGDLFLGLLWSALTLSPLAVLGYLYLAYPQINDVSTDLENPPRLLRAAQNRTPDMNAITPPTLQRISQQALHYPDIVGRRYVLPLDRVAASVQTLVAGEGWSVTETRDTVGVLSEVELELVAVSNLLSLPADVVLRLADEGASTFVDMRSVSRYGSHDFGENAARIVAFLNLLDQTMASQAGVSTSPMPVPEERPEN